MKESLKATSRFPCLRSWFYSRVVFSTTSFQQHFGRFVLPMHIQYQLRVSVALLAQGPRTCLSPNRANPAYGAGSTADGTKLASFLVFSSVHFAKFNLAKSRRSSNGRPENSRLSLLVLHTCLLPTFVTRKSV